jgi:hypothetical protein
MEHWLNLGDCLPKIFDLLPWRPCHLQIMMPRVNAGTRARGAGGGGFRLATRRSVVGPAPTSRFATRGRMGASPARQVELAECPDENWLGWFAGLVSFPYFVDAQAPRL